MELTEKQNLLVNTTNVGTPTTQQQAVQEHKSPDPVINPPVTKTPTFPEEQNERRLPVPGKTTNNGSSDTLQRQKNPASPVNRTVPPTLPSTIDGPEQFNSSVRTSPSFNYPPNKRSQHSNLRNQTMRPRSSSANDAAGSREKRLAKPLQKGPPARTGRPSILSLSGTMALQRQESFSEYDSGVKGAEKLSILGRLIKKKQDVQTQATDEERCIAFSQYMSSSCTTPILSSPVALNHLFGEEYNVENAEPTTESDVNSRQISEHRRQGSSGQVSNGQNEASLLREMLTSKMEESKEISDEDPAQYDNLQAAVQGLFSRVHPTKENWRKESVAARREESSQATTILTESQSSTKSPRFRQMGRRLESDVAVKEEVMNGDEREITTSHGLCLPKNGPLEDNRISESARTEDTVALQEMSSSNRRTSVSSLRKSFDTKRRGSLTMASTLAGVASIPAAPFPNEMSDFTAPSILRYPPSTPMKPAEKMVSLGDFSVPDSPVKQTFFQYLKHPIEESPETTWNLKLPGGLEKLYNSYSFQISLTYQRKYFLNVMGGMCFCTFIWLITLASNHTSAVYAVAATTFVTALAAAVVSYKPIYERFWISSQMAIDILILALVQICWLDRLANQDEHFQQGASKGHVNLDVILIIYNMHFISPLPMRYRLYLTLLIILSQMLMTTFVSPAAEDKDLISDFLIYLSTSAVGIFFSYVAEINSRKSFLKTRMLFQNQKRLTEAREQSERLLKTILPSKVIDGIKRSGLNYKNNVLDVKTQQANMVLNSTFSELPGVTILFADLAGFTEFSSSVTARELVNFIGEIFYKFDLIAASYGLEKIKTIGDCYNLCGGVPEAPRGEEQIRQYAQDICQMALRMVIALEEISEKRKLNMKIRVGIHTGTVLGGVIGRKKFKYDVWSEDVDIANSLEQSGLMNVPHVSSTTFFYAEHMSSLRFSPAEPKWTVKPPVAVTYNLYQEASYAKNETKLFNLSAQNFGAQTGRVASMEEVEGRKGSVGQEKLPWDPSMCVRSANALVKEIDVPQRPPPPTMPANFTILSSSKTKSANNTTKSVESDIIFRGRAEVQAVNQSKTTILKGGKALYDNALIESIKTEKKLFWGIKGEVRAWTNVFRDPSKELDFKQDYMKSYGRILILTAAFNMTVFAMLFIVYGRRSTNMFTLIPVTVMVTVLIAIIWATSRTLENHQRFETQHSGKLDNKQSNQTSVWMTSIETVGDKMKARSAGFINWWAPNSFAVTILLLITFGNLLAMPSMDNDYYHGCSLVILSLHSTFHGVRMQYLNLLVWAAAGLLECSYTLNGYFHLNIVPNPTMFAYTVGVALLVYFANGRHDLLVRRNFVTKRTLESKSVEIRTIQRDTEMLILNILPLSVVRRLKESPGVRIADSHDFAAILFAGIVNFIPFESAGQALAVKLLNETISVFDDCCNAHDVEKIKIIGTKYMAITTDMDQMVPDPAQAGRSYPSLGSRTGHVRRMIEYAFDIQEALEQINNDFEQSFGLKIGISAGPVVSGIIGSNKFSWDCWGDAVNVASRMESSGVEGAIQISQAVYEAVVDGPYTFQERGQVFIKGKGMMTTYFVTRKPFQNTASRNGDENVNGNENLPVGQGT